MKDIKTKQVEINKPIEVVYNTLSSFTSFSTLPTEEIKDFKSTNDTCSFRVKDMVEVELKITNREPYSLITIINTKDIMGFSFSMNFLLDKKDDMSCFLHGECEVKGNSMVLMMMKKQLEDGLNKLMDGIKMNLEK
jgi:hypothetical protein